MPTPPAEAPSASQADLVRRYARMLRTASASASTRRVPERPVGPLATGRFTRAATAAAARKTDDA
jgi:hypothetical protein